MSHDETDHSRPDHDAAAVALAVDLGGTRLRSAAVTSTGELLERGETSTPRDPQMILDRMTGDLGRLRMKMEEDGREVLGIGVSTAGCVDRASGEVVASTSALEGWNVPLKEHLEMRFELPARIENDGNCAVLAERAFGVGRGFTDLVYLILGTGIGGGIIIDDRLLRGATGAAAEVGHVPLALDGPLCSCGRRGCAEAWASGLGLARVAREEMLAGRLEIDGVTAESVDARDLGRAIAADNEAARAIVTKAGRVLGAAMAGFVNLFNPQRIILAGPVTGLGAPFLDPARQVLHERALEVPRDATELVFSDLDDAPLLGAAALFFED